MFIELVTVLVITLAFFIQTSVGFGAGLLAIPVLALFMVASQAITVILLFQFMNGALVFFNYKAIDWLLLKRMVVSVFIGCAFGTLLPAYLSHETMGFLLGVLILSYVLRNRVRPCMGKKFIQSIPPPLVGLLGGLVQGGFGIGGLVFVMYFNEVIPNKRSFRATLIATFFVCNFIRITVSLPTGLITADVLSLFAYALLPFLLVMYLGQKFHTHINEKIFNHIIDVFLVASGIMLISKTFL